MNYNRLVRNDSTTLVRVVCAIVFVVFTFLWVYCFQTDLLAYAQHVLSHGQTVYHPLIGALVITLGLWLLQMGVAWLLPLKKRTHALTYFPSMLALALLTSVGPDVGHWQSLLSWLWPLAALALWLAAAVTALRLQRWESSAVSGFFSRRMLINMFMMAMMMIGVALIANTNAVFHFGLRAESLLRERRFDKAALVGSRSLETDAHLTMVRMYALSRQGLLGDRLFEYPLVPSSAVMLPTGGDVTMLMYPTDTLYRYLGAKPREPMPPMDYLRRILRGRQATAAARDYLLCGFLLDKDLDAFAREVGKYYVLNDSLPLYYRQALVLYNHRRSSPVVEYHDDVLDADYADMQQLEATYKDPSERKGKVMENYANSYWYYYDYVNPSVHTASSSAMFNN